MTVCKVKSFFYSLSVFLSSGVKEDVKLVEKYRTSYSSRTHNAHNLGYWKVPIQLKRYIRKLLEDFVDFWDFISTT